MDSFNDKKVWQKNSFFLHHILAHLSHERCSTILNYMQEFSWCIEFQTAPLFHEFPLCEGHLGIALAYKTWPFILKEHFLIVLISINFLFLDACLLKNSIMVKTSVDSDVMSFQLNMTLYAILWDHVFLDFLQLVNILRREKNWQKYFGYWMPVSKNLTLLGN